MPALLEKQLPFAIKKKQRKCAMQRRLCAMHLGLRHRAQHIVLLIHQDDQFTQCYNNPNSSLSPARDPRMPVE